MFIALSFTWLYLHQGIKNPENNHRFKREVDSEVQEVLNPTNIEQNVGKYS